jgi:hypothetical protein
MHIQRQFNKVADNLSKKELNENIGWLYYEDLDNGTTVRSGKFYIF